MADDLDFAYIQTRQNMREYQSRMLMEPVQQGSDVYMGAKEGGKEQKGAKAGTPGQAETPQPEAPVTLAPDATVPPEQAATPQEPNTITVDRPEVAAVKQQFTAEMQKMAQGDDAVEALGRGGKAVAEAARPGFEVAARAIGMDEEAAATVGDAFVEFMGGLPGKDSTEYQAGVETALAALPAISGMYKTGKAVGKAVDKSGIVDSIVHLFSGGGGKDELGEAAQKRLGDLHAGKYQLGPARQETERGGDELVHEILHEGKPVAEIRIIKNGETAKVSWLGDRMTGEGVDPNGQVQKILLGPAVLRNIVGQFIEKHPDVKTLRYEHSTERGVIREVNLDSLRQRYQIMNEFKRAGDILKSERGSVPLGGGGAKPPEMPGVSVGAAAEPPMNAKQLATIAKREESKQAHEFALEGFKEEVTKQRRGPVLSDEAVRKLAGESGFTLQDLLDLKPGSVLAPEIQVKAREVYKATVDNMKQSAKAYLATGSPQDFEAFAQAFTMAGLSTTRIIGTYSEAGRTFRLLNQKYPSLKKPGAAQATDPEFSIQDQYISEMYKFFRGVEEKSKMGGFDKARTGQGMGPDGMVSPGQLAQMVVDLPNEEAMMAFAKAALKPTWGDMMYEVWVNGLLSGPITHSTNIISNAATLLWNIPERQVASLIKPGSVRPGEAAAMIGGVVESVGDAWRLAWKAFKQDAPQFGASKLENMPRQAITADALEVTGIPGRAIDFLASAVGLGQGKWLDKMGTGIRLPGRFLMAGDDFFKSIAFRAELRSLAKRQAFREVNELGLTGKDAARKAKEIEQKILTDPPETIKQDAQEFAAYTTFTRELGTAGSAVQNAVQNVPFGRVVLPFIRTPANIFKFAGERTPLALASKAVRDELAAGGERQALALAKIGLGSMTMAYMATLAANGHITGGGPKDKVLRKQLELEGWQPYSFKIGNEYVSYARIEPLGSLIGMAADAADLMGQLGTKDSAELASALTVAMSRNVANKTFVKGLAGTLNAVTSQDVHVVKSFLEKELPTLMPYSSAMGQTAKVVDPVMRDVKSILDAFQAKVPGFSDDLPPQRNLYGDKVLLQGGMGPDLFSPLYVREIKNDPVAHELSRLAYPFAMPARNIDGIDLPPKLYDRYAELAGKGSDKTGNQTLQAALNETMQTGIYKQAADGPDGGKVTLIKATLNRFREMAALQLEQENKDFAQARQKQRMRAATKFDQNARQKAGPAPTLQ